MGLEKSVLVTHSLLIRVLLVGWGWGWGHTEDHWSKTKQKKEGPFWLTTCLRAIIGLLNEPL